MKQSDISIFAPSDAVSAEPCDGKTVKTRHWIWQHEGGEQGDPLMPLLFSLAIHDALVEVRRHLRDWELLFAYLDDVHVVSKPDGTHFTTCWQVAHHGRDPAP